MNRRAHGDTGLGGTGSLGEPLSRDGVRRSSVTRIPPFVGWDGDLALAVTCANTGLSAVWSGRRGQQPNSWDRGLPALRSNRPLSDHMVRVAPGLKKAWTGEDLALALPLKALPDAGPFLLRAAAGQAAQQ